MPSLAIQWNDLQMENEHPNIAIQSAGFYRTWTAHQTALRTHPKALNGPGTEELMFARWAERMSSGAFEEAWRINDAHERRWPSAHVLSNGCIHDAKVIVRSLHGLGDAVQMLRYAPLLREFAHTVAYQVPSSLVPLMPYFRDVDDFGSLIPSGGDEVNPTHVSLEIMELPYIFRTSLDQLPLQRGYLDMSSARAGRHDNAACTHGRKRVGLVWAGGEWDPYRWVPFHSLRPLLEDSRVQWWNLQGGEAAAEADGTALRIAPKQRGGVLTLARAIATMDLVITIDTLAAHLAGAIGIPTWLMLKHNADWRWMVHRSDSPWYPSMKLFRQARPGDWGSVIAAVEDNLQHAL